MESFQEKYELLSEKWCVEKDRTKEEKILVEIEELLISAKKNGFKIVEDSWIREALNDRKQK